MDYVKIFIERLLYPAMNLVRGNRTLEYLQKMKKTQYASRAELLSFQEGKLSALLLDCVKNVPYYQKYDYLEEAIKLDPLGALNQFPILDKETFRKNSELFFNSKLPESERIENYTGGSTGEKTRFFMNRETVEHYEAARWRGLSWHGITPGSRSVMLWGNPIELSREDQKKYEFKEKWLKNRVIIPAFALEEQSIRNYVAKIDAYKPEYIYGYASALDAFAKLMRIEKLNFKCTLKAAVSTAETLYPHQRENIEKAFGCRVVNEYGARDAGILAYECSAGELHISSDNAIIEVIDFPSGKEVPCGKSGDVVVTDLNNHIMPRLRYRLGDEVILTERRCDCGVNLPLMESIVGRNDEMLHTPGGLLVHGYLVAKIAQSHPVIKRFQIIQKEVERATLRIEPAEGRNSADIDLFVEEVGAHLPGVAIDVKFGERIEASPSGKFRYCIGMGDKAR
ncbi:MAG: phenylacetate--CoA ligase family protein [Clostridiales bacterium]|nr:phenylacetate--CoA ligase family protein [Clostridiales bacterium]